MCIRDRTITTYLRSRRSYWRCTKKCICRNQICICTRRPRRTFDSCRGKPRSTQNEVWCFRRHGISCRAWRKRYIFIKPRWWGQTGHASKVARVIKRDKFWSNHPHWKISRTHSRRRLHRLYVVYKSLPIWCHPRRIQTSTYCYQTKLHGLQTLLTSLSGRLYCIRCKYRIWTNCKYAKQATTKRT